MSKSELVTELLIAMSANVLRMGRTRQQAKKGKRYRLTQIAVARDHSTDRVDFAVVDWLIDRLGRKSTGTTLV
jgi:hypothetical protein